MRFAVISDTHYYTNGHGKSSIFWNRPLPEQMDEIARETIDQINSLKLDFVIHCGDFVDRHHADNYAWAHDIIRRLNCPCYLAVGNHDTLDHKSRDALDVIFSFPGQSSYYTRCVNGVTFIFLDCCYWLGKDGSVQPYRKQSDYEAGQIKGMIIPDHEISWLADELESHKNNLVMVVSHAPLAFKKDLPVATFPDGRKGAPGGTDAASFIESMGMSLYQREKAVALISAYPNVKVAFSGHWHIIDSFEADGTVYCQTGSLRESPFEFRVVSIDQDRIQIQTASLDKRFSDASYVSERGNSWVRGTEAVRCLTVDLQDLRSPRG